MENFAQIHVGLFVFPSRVALQNRSSQISNKTGNLTSAMFLMRRRIIHISSDNLNDSAIRNGSPNLLDLCVRDGNAT
jgi:aromatic ring-opening dioxygenase LigB subunit